MTTDALIALVAVMMGVLLLIAIVGAAVVGALLWRRWRRNHPKQAWATKPAPAPAPAAQVAPPAASAPAAAVRRDAAAPTEAVPKGDAPADDERILALDLEEPTSIEAVLRNLQRVKPLLKAEAAESDRMGRTTPLAGRALRASGLYRWGFPTNRGGLGASYAERLEAVTQIARIDAGMAWVVHWISAHGELTGRLDDEAFGELYPTTDLPTVFSATPLARATLTDGGTIRIDEAKWRLGSGGYHADRWLAGVKVWDAAGKPVIDETTEEQLFLGVWLPADKVRQADDWNPLGMRSTGSATYYLSEPIEIPRRWSFNAGAEVRPYFFPFMGVMAGAAQHLIDLTLEALRAKRQAGIPVGSHDMSRLTEAMASLDMLILGLRGYAGYLDSVASDRASGVLTKAELAWVHSVGMPVRTTVLSIRDVAADIYGTGFVSANSEFGRVLRDIQVALAHAWFRLSDTQADRSWRTKLMLDDPAIVPLWDQTFPMDHALEK
jgi:alkylation response protein AidB-like acyl-CoA dehydrogenase